MNRLFKTIFAVGTIVGASLCAVAAYDLPINGNFRDAAGHRATGWILPAHGVRFYPQHRGKHMLELFAAPQAPNIAATDLYPIGPGTLEVKADISGRGVASLGFEAFDASRSRIVQSGRQQWQLNDVPGRIKFNFPLSDPSIAYVRITLTAEPGSVARFTDVEADMHYAPAPMPPAPVPTPVPAPQALVHNSFFHLSTLPPVSEFTASVYAGSDIELKLSEHPSRGQVWSHTGAYNPRVCRVEIDHKHRKGQSYAKIELKGLHRGTTRLIFSNPAGKQVIIHFTSM